MSERNTIVRTIYKDAVASNIHRWVIAATIMDAIIKAKPASAKGTYLKSVAIATTMGPGIKVSTAKYGV